PRHLNLAIGRTHGLRGKAGKFDLNPLLCQRLVGLYGPDARAGIAVTKGCDTVENEVGATVPEIAQVVDGVDHGRSVARRHLPRVYAVDVKDRIGNGLVAVHWLAGVDAAEV